MRFASAATALLDDALPWDGRHAGSVLSAADRRRLTATSRPRVTRVFVLSAALLSVAAVLAGIAALPSLEARVESPVFRYQVLPVPLANRGVPLRPGQPVPLLLTRCVDDPSLDGLRAGYDLSRALVAADDDTTAAMVAAFADVEPGPPARLVLPPTFADAANGCEQTVSSRNVLPATTPAGSYFLEGVARYVGPTGRTGSTYWRSENFTVTGA